MDNNENIQFDCNRGCTVTRDANDELNCTYRRGCCKLEDYNWLSGISQGQYSELFEVRFKNTRKGIYINASGQSIKMGDLVIVEAQSGHDLGIVTLEGPVVGRQMKCKGIDPEHTEFKKIYRKAKSLDIEKWQEAIAREQEAMIRSRQIAVELGLDMKIGDVEFQGDGTKAIFYYIADGRVDFRQLIKVFAEEFRIRIEMKQIGARQEAGLIGGLGVCGRELCCANYITNFKSITTAAARCQDLSLNPQKLAGQCGKLKCCLNYEVATYLDAQSRIPRVSEPLEFQDGLAYLMKTDILKEVMYFSYDKGSLANLFPLAASEVREIIKMNRNGVKPESLKTEPEPEMPEFITAVGDDSITRFDAPNRKKRRNQQRGRQNDKPQAKPKVKDNSEAQQPEVNADVQDRPQRQQQDQCVEEDRRRDQIPVFRIQRGKRHLRRAMRHELHEPDRPAQHRRRDRRRGGKGEGEQRGQHRAAEDDRQQPQHQHVHDRRGQRDLAELDRRNGQREDHGRERAAKRRQHGAQQPAQGRLGPQPALQPPVIRERAVEPARKEYDARRRGK